jgi:hypothetical protein
MEKLHRSRSSRLGAAAVAAAVVGVIACTASPQGDEVVATASAALNDIQYCDFTSVAGLQLNGNATQVSPALRLTQNTTNQDSSVFRTTTLALTATTDFHTHFQFTLTPGASQADGITFVVQSDPRGAAALGGNGGGIGYGASNGGTHITPAVEIELDAFKNTWDTNANHVGIMRNGDETTHIAQATPAFTIASSAPIDAWVDYTAATTTLAVYVANTASKPATPLVTSTTVNVFTTVGANARFGFTGSTGGASELQVLSKWILSLAPLIECPCTTNAQCGGTTPFCAPVGDPLAGTCVACVTTAECDTLPNTATPICSKAGATTDTCRACATNVECTAAGLAAVCVTAAGAHQGQCAQCATSADCVAPTPACVDTGATNVCVQCATNANCSGKTPSCNTTTHTCGPCISDANCAAPTPACQTSGTLLGECTQCSATNKTACTGATPACNTTTGSCVACNIDADCAGGNWCNETAHTCTPKLPNGTAVPTDAAHANPTLNGTCTVAAGALVCVSGVCDTKDNDCGYANGDGPCNAGNGGTVCRSGACSTAGVCLPPGGCASDADCAKTQWCDESTSTCTAKLANGTAVPNDPPHSNPTLNGTCTPTAGALVCVSGVCDTKDNECGYANGDGPCNAGNGATVCRSDACSVNGTCEPGGGCNVNADCKDPANPLCDSGTHTCHGGADAGPEAGPEPTPEAGSPEAGVDASVEAGVDATAPEAGKDAAPEASGSSSGSSSGSASSSGAGEAGPEDNGGYLEGGGISCSISREGASGGAGWIAIGIAAAGLVRRRPARRARPRNR